MKSHSKGESGIIICDFKRIFQQEGDEWVIGSSRVQPEEQAKKDKIGKISEGRESILVVSLIMGWIQG